MAIAFDAASNGTAGASESITWSHTTTGANRILFVDVLVIGASETITGVTYDSVSMTQIDKKEFGTNWKYMYVLEAPSTGANNVVVTGSSSAYKVGCSASYTGANQSTTMDSSASYEDTGQTSPYRKSTTTVADNCWVLFSATQDAGVLTAEQTERCASADGYCRIEDDNSAKTPAGSVTMGWTFTGTQAITSIILSFSPVSGPANVKTYNDIASESVKTIKDIARASVKTWNDIA